MVTHPIARFRAATSIMRGVPLKELISRKLIQLIAESLTTVVPSFNSRTFCREGTKGLDELELMDRANHIARAMAEQLPDDFDVAGPMIVDSLGPELQATAGNGLAPFFYLPHAQFVAIYGVERFNSGMRANYELTKRMTAEFSVRPFLNRYREKSLELLTIWARDQNAHVRRLASEGTRPRLPWAPRLKEFQADPHLSLPLLELLKDDAELYVRRSVANHLADILKDHPDVAMEVCERWLRESKRKGFAAETAAGRRWMIRHAVRLPAKKGDPQALAIRAAAN